MDESSRACLLILLVMGVMVVVGAVGVAVAPRRRRRETHMMLVLGGRGSNLHVRRGRICVIPRPLACEKKGNVMESERDNDHNEKPRSTDKQRVGCADMNELHHDVALPLKKSSSNEKP